MSTPLNMIYYTRKNLDFHAERLCKEQGYSRISSDEEKKVPYQIVLEKENLYLFSKCWLAFKIFIYASLEFFNRISWVNSSTVKEDRALWADHKTVCKLTLNVQNPLDGHEVTELARKAAGAAKIRISEGEMSDAEAAEGQAREAAAAKADIKITIPSKVKTTLDQLFEDSLYSIDNLPVYPIVLDEQNGAPERKKMTAPVMKGMCYDGRAFIIIKVDCDLRDEDIEKHAGHYEEVQNHYKTHRQLKDVLMLFQYTTKYPLMWDQLGRGQSMHPSFFTWNFTYPEDGSGPTNSQKENFKLVQTLLKTGESPDTKGLVWRIPV